MNADAVVMEYYPSTLDNNESDAMANKLKGFISKRSWGFWAVETIEGNEFIGFVGLHKPLIGYVEYPLSLQSSNSSNVKRRSALGLFGVFKIDHYV